MRTAGKDLKHVSKQNTRRHHHVLLFFWSLGDFVFQTLIQQLIPIKKLGNMQKLHQFIHILTQDSLYLKILTFRSNIYSLRSLKLETITPALLHQHLQKVSEEGKQPKSQGQAMKIPNTEAWTNNQFKIFVWISVCYSYLMERSFSAFSDLDYQFIRPAFPHKSRQFLRYNIRSLLKEDSNRRSKWTEQEINLLRTIMIQQKTAKDHLKGKQSTEFKWTHISFQLFTRSNEEFLQFPQQCREKWINHLNPQVKKGKWTTAQDILLFQSVLKEGKKWSQISKIFKGQRTEHMVKNRYKSFLNKTKSRSKKISQRKYCQSLLLIMEQKLTKSMYNTQRKKQNLKIASQTPSQSLEKDSQNIIQFIELPKMLLAKIQTQTENIIKQDHKKGEDMQFQILGEEQMSSQYEFYPHQINFELQNIEIFEQNKFKGQEDIFFLSLLQ